MRTLAAGAGNPARVAAAGGLRVILRVLNAHASCIGVSLSARESVRWLNSHGAAGALFRCRSMAVRRWRTSRGQTICSVSWCSTPALHQRFSRPCARSRGTIQSSTEARYFCVRSKAPRARKTSIAHQAKCHKMKHHSQESRVVLLTNPGDIKKDEHSAANVHDCHKHSISLRSLT